MDFALTRAQQQLVEAAREGARDVLAVNAAKYDLAAEHPVESFTFLRQQGYYSMAIPKRYGGWGLDLVTYCLLMHELAQGCASTATSFNMHNVVMYGIEHLGTEEQKARWFGRVVNDGALVGSWGSEPGASFSTLRRSLGTALVPHDGGWLMSGQKYFCSLAGGCDYALLFAVPHERLGQENQDDIITALVPASAAGVEIQPGWDPLGLRATTSSSVRLQDVFVSRADVLGGPGDWFRQACNQRFEVGYGAIYAGVAQAALDFATEYAWKRVLRPDDIRQAELPWMQMRIGELAVGIEGAFLTTLKSAWAMEQDYGEAVAAGAGERAKGAGTRVALDTTVQAFDICGGSSIMRNFPLERYFRDARTQTLMAPSYDHLLRVIGKEAVHRVSRREQDESHAAPATAR